jgi:hypothetical protein
MRYEEFIERKSQLDGNHGFAPVWMPEWLFDFQAALVEWAVRKGRAAIFADCGLGKGPMSLVWAENVARRTGGRVLILTPIAVGPQLEREAVKFGIGAEVAAKSKAMTVPCPVCDAQVGEPCDTELSRARVIHLTRYADVLIAAMGAKP